MNDSEAFQRIEGVSIDLVEIEPAYSERVIAWRNDPDNRRCFFSQIVWTVEIQRRWYESYRQDRSDQTCIILLKDGHPIGMAGIYSINENEQSAEFGRLLIGDPQYRRRGMAFEACCLLLSWLFETKNVNRAYLEVHSWNTAAISLYERLGFHRGAAVAMSGGVRALRMELSRERFDTILSEAPRPKGGASVRNSAVASASISPFGETTAKDHSSLFRERGFLAKASDTRRG